MSGFPDNIPITGGAIGRQVERRTRRRRRMVCESCHTLKRKCSRDFPSCLQCSSQNLVCEYRDLAAEKVDVKGKAVIGGARKDATSLVPTSAPSNFPVVTIKANARFQLRAPFDHAIDRCISVGDSYLRSIVEPEILYGLYDLWREWTSFAPSPNAAYATETTAQRLSLYNSFLVLTAFTYGCSFSQTIDLLSRTRHFASIAFTTGAVVLECIQEHPEEFDDRLAVGCLYLWRGTVGVIQLTLEETQIVNGLLFLVQNRCRNAHLDASLESRSGLECISALALQNRGLDEFIRRSAKLRRADLAIPTQDITFPRALSALVSLAASVLFSLACVGIWDMNASMVNVTLGIDIPEDLKVFWRDFVMKDLVESIDRGLELLPRMPRLHRMIDVCQMHAGYMMWRLNDPGTAEVACQYSKNGLEGWFSGSGEPGYCLNSTCVDSILLAMATVANLEPLVFLIMMEKYDVMGVSRFMLSPRGRAALGQVVVLSELAKSSLKMQGIFSMPPIKSPLGSDSNDGSSADYTMGSNSLGQGSPTSS